MFMCLEVGTYHVLGTAVLAKNAAKNRTEPFGDYSEHIVSQSLNDALAKDE